MLSRLLSGEPDVFLFIIQYLSLGSVVRLQTSCRLLNDFIASNKRRIRGLLKVDINLHVDGVKTVVLKSNQAVKANQVLHFIVQSKDDIEDLDEWTKHTQINDKLTLYKRKRNSDFAFLVKEEIDLSEALAPMANFLFSGFNFKRLDIIVDRLKLIGFIAQLFEWFIASESTFESVYIKGGCSSDSDLIRFLGLLKVENFTRTGQLSSERFSTDFFLNLPRLRRLNAPCAECTIDDEQFKQFDVFNIRGGETNISLEGILDWVQRRFNEKTGFQVKENSADIFLNCNFTLDILEDRLKKLYVFCQSEDEGLTMFRGPTGKWLSSLRDDAKGPGVIILQECANYWDCFVKTPKKSHPKFPIALTIQTDTKGYRGEVCLSNRRNKQHFKFTISKKKPEEPSSLLLEQWTNTISLYETDFGEITIFIDKEQIGQQEMQEALENLAKRVLHRNFVYAECTSTQAVDSLRLLLMLEESLRFRLQLECLISRGLTAITDCESCLIEVIQKMEARGLQLGSLNETDDMEPVILSANFFESTPTLKSLSVGLLSGPSRHVLGLDDQILLHFESVLAECASTDVSQLGFRAWIEKVLNGGFKTACSIQIGLPFTDDPLKQGLFYEQLTKDAVKRSEKIFEWTKKDSKFCARLEVKDSSITLSSKANYAKLSFGSGSFEPLSSIDRSSSVEEDV